MSKLTQASVLVITIFSVSFLFTQEGGQEESQFGQLSQKEMVPMQSEATDDRAGGLDDLSQGVQPNSLPEPTISDLASSNVSSQDYNSTDSQEQQNAPIEVDSQQDQEEVGNSEKLESSDQEPIGIDTIRLQEPQGNWLFKRIWWERAQERYEKIRVLVDQIWELRVGFFLNRSEVDRTKLDPFYIFIGFEQGVVQEELNSLIEKLTKEEQEAGTLDTEEKTLLLDIQEQKKTLENLRSDIDLISQFDHSIDEALERLMEQINRVRVYERDSWNAFKEIAQVLSDTKARELYYKMDTSWRNIKDIYRYLQNDFLTHFQDIISKLNAELARVRGVVEGLKEKGFDLKKQSELLKESAHQPLQPALEDEESDEEQSVPKKGFFASIGSSIVDGFSLFWGVITAPFSYIYHKILG